MPLKYMRGETLPAFDEEEEYLEVDGEGEGSSERPMRGYSDRGPRMAKQPRPMQAVPTRTAGQGVMRNPEAEDMAAASRFGGNSHGASHGVTIEGWW